MPFTVELSADTGRAYPWLIRDEDGKTVGMCATEDVANAFDKGHPDKELVTLLGNMTGLVKLKYGNSDPEIWSMIQRAEALIFERFLDAQGTR